MYRFIILLFIMTSPLEATFTLTSPVIKEGKPIDKKYTCKGGNMQPPLHWSGAPKGTKAFVLICDDPDAPTATPWVHWVLYNISSTMNNLSHPHGRFKELPNGTKQGINSWKRIGYDGPCPPAGKPHRYYFRLYALSKPLSLPAGATKEQVLAVLKPIVLGSALLMGTFKKD